MQIKIVDCMMLSSGEFKTRRWLVSLRSTLSRGLTLDPGSENASDKPSDSLLPAIIAFPTALKCVECNLADETNDFGPAGSNDF